MGWMMIDTETTGLPKDELARVVEIAVARYNDRGELLSAYSTLVKPDVIHSDGYRIAEKISGITREMIDTAPSADEVVNTLHDLTDGWSVPVTSWNRAFDERMIKRMTSRFVPAWKGMEWRECAMMAFSEKWKHITGVRDDGSAKWVSLERAANLTGTPRGGLAHRALSDCLLAGTIFAKLMNGEAEPPAIEPAPRIVIGG